MNASVQFLNPAEAARRLGVSAKALRLYEQRGLVAPVRTAAGWRAYGPEQMVRAGEIAALRALGLSLAQVARVLGGDVQDLEPALAAHQAALEGQAHRLAETVDKVRALRTALAQGQAPARGELTRLLEPRAGIVAAFDLPWPWNGERFELRDIRLLTHIVGPLGSGKTRLIERLAATITGAAFVGLDRLMAKRAPDERFDQALAWLAEEGATISDALQALVAGLIVDGPSVLVIDMLEQGLDQATQEALMVWLRRRGADARPIFFTTRSNAILDLGAVGADEAIILCPANHSPPARVAPYPGAPGYEAIATCLASPDVRARSEGVVAWRPSAA